jgi:hypothetical protein
MLKTKTENSPLQELNEIRSEIIAYKNNTRKLGTL